MATTLSKIPLKRLKYLVNLFKYDRSSMTYEELQEFHKYTVIVDDFKKNNDISKDGKYYTPKSL
jgi:uncharacterized protein YeeX (DUF496 family)